MDSSDLLLERSQLNRSLVRWRNIAIIIAVLWLLSLSILSIPDQEITTDPHIAHIHIEGIILDDRHRDEILRDIAEDNNVKAVIMSVNSPGGTLGGSEALYQNLSRIKAAKPIVTNFQSLAASGGYMAAMASDYIFTRETTLTGSIGVILQAAEFSELAKKIGIGSITIKSGDLKGAPSPAEKLSPEARQVLQAMISDSHDFFVGLVAENRNIPSRKLATLTDGRAFTGRQAVKHGLADAIGDHYTAEKWLNEKHQIDLPVIEYDLIEEDNPLEKFLKTMVDITWSSQAKSRDGLLAIWRP